MKDFSFGNAVNTLGLTAAVDVFDDQALFQPLNNEDVLGLSQLGGADGFSGTAAILRSTGISQRRVLRAGVAPIDLAIAVCRKLEQISASSLREFGHILLCHSHVDPTACEQLAARMSARLGLAPNSISAFNHGCSGFLKLMTEGSLLLEDSEPGAKVALVSIETPEFWHDASDRLFCGLVSAGATAAVMEVGAEGLPISSVKSDDFRIPADRRPNPEPLFSIETGDFFDFHGNPSHRQVMRMNAEPVFLNGIELMLDSLRSALMSIDRRHGERVIVAPHQPSGKLLKALIAAAKLEFPEIELLNNLEFYGNTISSSVPTLVSRFEEVLQRNNVEPPRDGDHIILLAAGICMNEINDHMSAGYACMKWQSGALNASRRQSVMNAAR